MAFKLPPLNSKQKKQIIIGGVSLFALVMGGVGALLNHYGETTIQNRIAQTPSVTISLIEKKEEEAKVPDSWQTEKVEEPKPETAEPPVKPEAEKPPTPDATPESKPVVEEGKPPAPQVEPEKTAAATESQATSESAVVTNEIPMVKYARPFDQQDPRPRIALIVEDMGMAASLTQSAIQDLPGTVTLAFSPFAPSVEADMLKARAAGHEMLLSIPMQPDNYPRNDSGPNSLLVSLSNEENTIRMNRALSRSEGYVGVIPSMGQRFVTQESKLTPVLQELLNQGLIIVDGTMANASMVAPVARLKRLPFARSEIRVDAASRAGLDAQLAEVENLAMERGQAVVLIKPYPVTIEKLTTWIQSLDQKGLVLAPVTAVTSMAVVPAVSKTMPPAQVLPETPVEQQVDAAMDTPTQSE